MKTLKAALATATGTDEKEAVAAAQTSADNITKIAKLETELAAKSREVETIQKQASSQSAEYLRQMEQIRTLQEKLSDYETMFGPSTKKKSS
jgi:uncharacterized coiled-coil protein SlyX